MEGHDYLVLNVAFAKFVILCTERERLIRYKFRWAEADEEPQDNKLSVDEMKDFRHPEQSTKMIVRMAKDIIENLGNEVTIVSQYVCCCECVKPTYSS
jgi:hypothetical protein